MKIYRYLSITICLLCGISACQKEDLATNYKDFLKGGEIVYTGAINNVIAQSGDLRVGLKWKSSTDPNIVKYVVYYNNRVDSQIVDASVKTDTIRTVITNLQEFTYSFTIVSFDAKGNHSVPFEVNNAKVYGPLFKKSLTNRGFDGEKPYQVNSDLSVTLNFLEATDTLIAYNTKTVISYTNSLGVKSEKILLPNSNSITLPDLQPGTEVSYLSAYMPAKNSIDTFVPSENSIFPRIIFDIQCDKSLFRENPLPNDVGTYDSSTSLSKLWDGSVGPQSFPNIFHSNNSGGMPHTITFDMGKVYNNLVQIEETGRDGYHNPDNFEVWGIADITGAATTLPASNSGWEAEAIAKGWTLLKEVTRTDDGKNPYKVDLISNPPPVRYIRLRIKHVVSNDSNQSNMSELTFWNRL